MFHRLLGCTVLALVVSGVSLNAQGTKKAAAEIGTIEVYKNKEGAYRYRIKSAEGKTIAIPLPQMSWEKKAELTKALDELRTILEKGKVVDVKE